MYKKLVRDKIPEIIKSNGRNPVINILSDKDYKIELEKKLIEECNEVLASNGADRIEELADVLEVIISLARLENKNLNDVISVCDCKRLERGGFSNKIYLENVD